MRPAIRSIKLSDTLTLSECHPTASCKGAWWLYDKTQGMNLAMGANTEIEALTEALDYYQGRLKGVETELRSLQSKVDGFLSQFTEDDE